MAEKKVVLVRAKPFTQTEKDELQRCIQRYASIVENKKSDATTLQKKQAAWEKIAREYNSSALGSQRTVAQLKRGWEVMKMNFKKTTAAVARHRMGTGGGPSIPDPTPDPLVEMIAPHLVHFVDQHQDSDAVAGILPDSGATGTPAPDDLSDEEVLDIDLDIAVVTENEPLPEVHEDEPLAVEQTLEPLPSTSRSQGLPQPAAASASGRPSRGSSRMSMLTEEHQERMAQLAADADHQRVLRELELRYARARAEREEFLLSVDRRREARREAREEELHRLQVDQMREKHLLECKRLGK